jgi:hypothetical protein
MEKRRILTRKGWLWNLPGDVRMGVMGSVSLKCQVCSFCNDSYIPLHLLFLPISMILPFFASFVRLSFLFLPRTCSLCLANVFSFVLLQHLLISPTFGISWMNRNSGHRSHPFLGAPDHGLFDKCLGSTVNNGSICASSPNLNYRLHPLT